MPLLWPRALRRKARGHRGDAVPAFNESRFDLFQGGERIESLRSVPSGPLQAAHDFPLEADVTLGSEDSNVAQHDKISKGGKVHGL